MAKIDIQELIEQVKANHARLDGCAGPHDFQDVPENRGIVRLYRCARCGGTVDAPARNWYQRGLRDALGGQEGAKGQRGKGAEWQRPGSSNIERSTRNSELGTPNSELNPPPQMRDPKSEIRNPQSAIPNPPSEIRDPK